MFVRTILVWPIVLNWRAFKSRNPNPPSSFGRHILPQLNQIILFFTFACPHQNLHTMAVISSQRVFGNLKMLMIYVGTTWATVLMSISFLACESSFSFQLESLLFSLSMNCWKVLHLFFPTKDGRPKYFSCCWMTSAPNLFLISSKMSCGVFWLKKREVLSWFSCWPFACSYVSNTLSKV